MLKFVLGRALSGKSYYICQSIAECVKSGKSPVLIIPEQFSFESEKRILSMLGDSDAQKVKVFSFSRLCDEVESITGGQTSELTDSEKIILMTAALKSVRPNLKYFSKYAVSPGFSKMMLNTAGEFIMNAVGADDLFSASEELGDGVLGRKLYDTAVILAEYNDLISQKLSGYKDRLESIYDTLENYRYFDNKTVFIDSFGGFTGQQYRIIDRILSQAEDVVVSLCDSGEKTDKYNIFANVKKAKDRICKMAEKHGVNRGNDTVLQSGKYVSEEIAALEEFMCFSKTDRQIGDAVSVCKCNTAYDEARFVSRNIRRIVRETGAKYSDFAVIARNAEDYEQTLLLSLQKNGIRCFSDKRLPLYTFPPASAVLAAMELTNKVTTEKIFRFHKSGVSFLGEDEISALEKYVYIWNIDGNTWNSEWTMDPAGLDSHKLPQPIIDDNIKKINSLREKAMKPILDFKSAFGGSAKNMARAVVSLLESANGDFSNISKDYKQNGNTELSEGIVTAYGKVMRILDSLVNCLDSNATATEFKDAFKNCINVESVGVIPQMVDEVIFGSAERIQPSRPHYVFIMGANSGVFPRAPKANGVFAVSEIGKLNSLGIDIPDCSVYSAIDEDLLVYNCVCCADKKVFISFNGKNGEMSYFLKKLTDRFCITSQNEPDRLNDYNLPETADDAFTSLCRSERGSTDFYTIKSVLEESEQYKDKIKPISDNDKRPSFWVKSEVARKLLGKIIGLSPSSFDTYSKCPFMYFCKYALSVKSIEPVSFSAMQSGTLLHFVLQKFVEETKDRIGNLDKDETDGIIERLVNSYLNSFSGYKDAETPHLKLMVSQMTDTLKYLAKRLSDEFAQCEFKPEKCEFEIRKGGDIAPLELPVDGEISVAVTGTVDRIDRYEGYVRIIDYKSGKREFKLPDILVGLNMQMLIYLYAVCKDKEFGGEPGGIFYMKAAMPEEDKPAARRMNGFMPEIPELITAMDKSKNGEFIPFSSPKSHKTGATADDFNDIFKFVELKLKQAGRDISVGRFLASPMDGRDKKACEYCEFSSICRIENEKPERAQSLKGREVISKIKGQVSGSDI